MRTKFNGILTLFLALIVQISFAQEKTISGTVSDQTGPLPGVTILKKGTTQGTETDFDGNYSIEVKTGDVLIFSFVGMKTAERTVGASNTISLIMETDNLLEEVVVTGYGTSTKQAYTGTATVIKSENLEAKSVSNVSQALAGEVAGVTVVNGSGQPGSTATIRIRGFGTINGNSDPLYVVDGVPYTNSISNINPADIESTTILKDATATSIYGSRGANGVIVITTKKGRNGVSNISVDVKTGVNMRLLPAYEVVKSQDEYIELSWESLKNTGEFLGNADPVAYANASLFSGAGISPDYNMWNIANVSELIDPTTGKVRPGVTRKYTPEDWSDYGFQSSIRTEANLSMSGGNDKTTYFSSFGYLNDKGYLVNSDFKRYSTRLNLTHNPTDWLEANANIDYSYGIQTANGQSEDSGSIFWFTDNIPSIYPLFLRDGNGNIVEDPVFGGNQYDYGTNRGFGGLTNAIADANLDLNQNKRHSINGNFSFKVNFTDYLSFTAKYGANYYSLVDNSINNPFYGSAAGQAGSLFKEQRQALSQNFLKMFNFNKSFGRHNITALLAHESNEWERDRTYISKNTVVNLFNGLDNPTNYVNVGSNPEGYKEETGLESYFAQANYSYDDKYFLSGTIRRDGSSRFAKNKWATFWSAGGSWIMSKENFMSNASFINYLKLKASYGIMGDQAGAGFYSGQNGYDIDNLDGDISLILRAIENSELTWESSEMFQAGTEFRLFNNVIDGSFDYYIKNTDDLLFDVRIPISSGDAILTTNDGSIVNRGFEFDLTGHIINKENFKLDLSVNGEMLQNEITEMPYDEPEGRNKIIDIDGGFGRAEGRSRFDYYMPVWAGVDPANGNPLWETNYVDTNNNGLFDSGEEILELYEYKVRNPEADIKQAVTSDYTEASNKFVGKSAIPTVRGAFRLSAKIHDFDISSQFAYSLGGYGYDGNYASVMGNDQAGGNNYHIDVRNRWQKPGDITNVPRLYSNQNIRVVSRSTRFLTKSDYLALNNVRIGYNLPTTYLENTGLSAVNIWFAGDNLFLLSARKGFNPSASLIGSSARYRYTPLSTFTLGIRVKI
ncbi:SusC/RagA family TonB-linked outer membrane protein [Tenacibaculum larymnensis]|uniref:SusC/RagA family TonB-linked outer membrane protein n=1 Tax=Tenacibaculum larymnensis TaxID=2878201 RepID=A0A9X4ET32_9FLAO|nr:SusC/RagA family TonB-linked outer membrane protein [Tenacibaculum larymnensis]MDE1206077.1 SusC/RagA family TonB-linked outer membrane protein [Tenacibaculum larymnensis]